MTRITKLFKNPLLIAATLVMYLTITFTYMLILPDRLIVVGCNDEHELIVRDKLFNRQIILVENAYAYPAGFRFVGWTEKDIQFSCIYYSEY